MPTMDYSQFSPFNQREGQYAVNSFKSQIPKVGNAIGRKMKDKSSASIISVIGDSTGDETTEWFELLINRLSARGSDSTAKIARWSDAAQGYIIPTTISQGSGEANVIFAGTHYIVSADSAQNSIAGDLTLIADISLTDWTPAAISPALITKFGAAGQRSYRWFIEQTTGLVVFAWYPDGTTAKTVKSSVAPTIADGQRLRLAVELDVDNGSASHAVKFYVGTGLNGWVQLGTTQADVTPGVTSIFDSTTQVAIGARSDSAVDNLFGTLYSASVVNGLLLTGKVAANYDPGFYPGQGGDATLIGLAGETWTPVGTPTINYSPMLFAYNGSCSGKNIAYSNDDTRLALQTPKEPNMMFISYGHNETWTVLATWDALATKIKVRYPSIAIVGVTQNPQKSPRLATQIARQQQIASDVLQVCAMQGYAVVNAFEQLSASPSTYVLADGVHPTPEGSSVWADVAESVFLPWPLF